MKKSYAQQFIYWLFFIFIFIIISACGSEESDIERGHRYIDREDYDKAIQNYSFAIKTNPSNHKAYFYRGIANLKANKITASLNDFSMAIKLKPNYFQAYINRGSLYKKVNNLEEALMDYNMAVQIKPYDLKVLMVRADILFAKGLIDKAILDYDTVISRDKSISKAFSGRADAYYHKNNYQKAINDYQAAIELNPNDVFSFNSLAWLLSTCIDQRYRDGERALQLSKKAVDIDPSIYNLSTLAAAYAEIGDYEKAINILRDLLESIEKDDDMKRKLNRYLSSFKNYKPLMLKAGE